MTANPKDKRGWVLQTVTSIPHRLEELVDALDWYIGGTRVVGRFRKRSLLAFVLPICVFFFVVYGPAGLASWANIERRGAWALLLVVGASALQLGYFLQPWFSAMASVHTALVCILASCVLCFGQDQESGDGLYRHYYAVYAPAILLLALCAQLVRRRKWFGSELRELEQRFDPGAVVAAPPPVKWNKWDFFRAIGASVLHTPLHVVTPVALFTLLARPEWLGWAVPLGLGLSWLLIAAGHYDPQRDAFLRFMGQVFLSGAALIVTLGVITLAVLRIVGLSYVTTVLDAGSKLTLSSYVLSTYLLLWLYDFWIQQARIETLGGLESFKRPAKGTATAVDIWRHGAGRVVLVVGEARRIFDPTAFLSHVAELAPLDERESCRQKATRIGQGLTFVSTVMTALLAIPLALAIGWAKTREQVPGLTTRDLNGSARAVPFDLAARLRDAPQGQPVVLLAASGGGTRAALYAAGVLRGLQRLNQLQNVLVASGVSGGSAALAYFATFRRELIDGDERRWRLMSETLAQPFIDDVFAGAGELRIMGGTRLGQLLTDSFERHFFAHDPTLRRRMAVGSDPDLGLIFNTSICGQCPNTSCERDSPDASAVKAGGFVTITNLQAPQSRQAEAASSGWTLEVPVEPIRSPAAPLFAAASLSANFPPVFPNAAIELDDQQRFWVTDGGAVENRGLITLIMELDAALEALQVEARGAQHSLPDIRIVLAEASAFDQEYRSDRGLGAKFGAAEKIANGYIEELVQNARQRHSALTGRPDGVQIVYVPMPDALRASGTFGTHWMMPPRVPFGTRVSAGDRRKIDSLEAAIVRQLIDAMFSEGFCEKYGKEDWEGLPAAALASGLGDPKQLPWRVLAAGFEPWAPSRAALP